MTNIVIMSPRDVPTFCLTVVTLRCYSEIRATLPPVCVRGTGYYHQTVRCMAHECVTIDHPGIDMRANSIPILQPWASLSRKIQGLSKRFEHLLWPPRPPDLTPCVFFLWGKVKDNAYKPQTARSHSSCGANH